MRKKIIDSAAQNLNSGDSKWLDVKRLAEVEISSENSDYPIENAFDTSSRSAWRASTAGKQIIRLIFDEPQQIRMIYLLFKEEKQERSQEFVLRWSGEKDQPLQEIVRQQYNFNPESATEEEENYTVNLEGVKVLELAIVPDKREGKAHASINSFWLA